MTCGAQKNVRKGAFPVEEKELIQRARRGDRTAFEALVDRWQKPVYHQALRLLNNREDAADVTQEVFLKLWRALPDFRGESSLSTWLYRLTDNTAIDLLRREKKRRGDLSLDDENLAVCTPASPASSPQEQAERRELQSVVADALARLNPEHRRVLVLRELNGLSYEEIGRILTLNPGTVKSRIARARLALAKLLDGTFSPVSASKGVKGGDGHES